MYLLFILKLVQFLFYLKIIFQCSKLYTVYTLCTYILLGKCGGKVAQIVCIYKYTIDQ